MYVRRGLGASSLVASIAAAIARQENTNPAYNNPGGLVSGPGQIGTASNGLAIFPDAATGEAALERQIQLYIDRGVSISDLTKAWAPVGCGAMCAGNDPVAYAQHLSSWTGLDPNVPLNQQESSPALSAGATSEWDSAPSDYGTETASVLDAPWLPWALGLAAAGLLFFSQD